MTFDPILAAPPVVQAHIAAAVPALLLGPFALFRTRRDRLHKALGYGWIVAVSALALTGLLIGSELRIIGHFGPIHLFSVLALWGVAEGLWHIRAGRVAEHRSAMRWTWFGAMGLAGLLTLLPGRTINEALFGGTSQAGLLAAGLGLAGLALLWRRPTPGRSARTGKFYP